MYNQKTGEFSTTLGPVFTHLLLADEINRAPALASLAAKSAAKSVSITAAPALRAW